MGARQRHGDRPGGQQAVVQATDVRKGLCELFQAGVLHADPPISILCVLCGRTVITQMHQMSSGCVNVLAGAPRQGSPRFQGWAAGKVHGW